MVSSRCNIVYLHGPTSPFTRYELPHSTRSYPPFGSNAAQRPALRDIHRPPTTVLGQGLLQRENGPKTVSKFDRNRCVCKKQVNLEPLRTVNLTPRLQTSGDKLSIVYYSLSYHLARPCSSILLCMSSDNQQPQFGAARYCGTIWRHCHRAVCVRVLLNNAVHPLGRPCYVTTSL